jgi:spoIIIJ-associated protein
MESTTSESIENEEETKGRTGPAPEKAARALEVARGLAERMGIEASIQVDDQDERIVIRIDEKEGSTDVAEVLGKSRPPAIPSFQFLLNKIVNRFPDDRKHILVEVPTVPRRKPEPRVAAPEGLRKKKVVELDPELDPTLVTLGQRLAERALALGKVLTVHPMSSADRRAVHQTIMTLEGVHTVSEGEGPYRRMHIVPDALQPQNKKRRRRRRRRGPEDGSGNAPRGEEGGSVADGPASSESESSLG